MDWCLVDRLRLERAGRDVPRSAFSMGFGEMGQRKGIGQLERMGQRKEICKHD